MLALAVNLTNKKQKMKHGGAKLYWHPGVIAQSYQKDLNTLKDHTCPPMSQKPYDVLALCQHLTNGFCLLTCSV